jgi:glycine/D-amino acid oxidase-like deaminating enzyme
MSATYEKDLRTGRAFWQSRRLSKIETRALRRDVEADVLIVGAGVSGAMTAEALSEVGLRVVIVDRRGALKGSTTASTALLQYEIDVPLSKLAKRIGRDRAERIWRRSYLALSALRDRARRLDINADIINRDSLYLQGDELDAEGLRVEGATRRRAGFEVAYLTARQVEARFGISGRAALLGFDDMSADPRRLAAGFLNAAIGRGAALYSPVEIDEIESDTHSISAQTETGQVIRAKTLIFATGYELPKGVPRMGHTIASTFVMTTKPQPRALWPERCLIWEASSPYLYLREAPGGRIVCGGEDEDFSTAETRDALLPQKIVKLQQKLGKLLPGVDVGADYAWCGSFGGSKTGCPSIGAVPGMPNCYALLGYGGNGITFSMLAAQILTGLIVGDGDPDADLFSFRRRF